MDSFQINNIKVGKANGVAKKPQFRKMASLFRVVEICVLLVVVARILAHLPLAVKSSSEHFKDLTVVLVSPRFVFIIGNLIVFILFAKSGQFSAQDSTGKNPQKDCFEEFWEKGEKIQNTYWYELKNRKKQSICEENAVNEGTHTSCKSISYRRSQSEKLSKSCQELRRSDTENCRKSTNSGNRSAKNSHSEDNMSNEEFRRTIEAFIARQQRFRMEEEYSMI
ncbi:uncharacterized protein LOC123213289 [Mangifera indica]|uniref:uncharacterized protein LOC123213289 n=1 Tax=Mangifera indica TaxID=29780 RepID=UPI001CFA0F28|nr:uncharacterized protein LOC123213289 [Mangifera indica]